MSLSVRRRLVSVSGVSALALAASGLALTQPALLSSASAETSGADCVAAATSASGPDVRERQRAFDAAARAYGVPADVLLGVSYMQSRWDDHGVKPSTSGGYGPMHLTDVRVPDTASGKGEAGRLQAETAESLRTAERAADLTGLAVRRVTSDDIANICGGAAVLASYQRDLGQPTGADTSVQSWYDSVARYSWAVDVAEQRTFADRVFATIKRGESRVTNDGQRVTLAAHPELRVPGATAEPAGVATEEQDLHCPDTIVCEWIPAGYEQYGPTVYDYGNHDQANRPEDMQIDYIIIHDTETSYDGTIRLVTDPTYLSWHYTLRSSDGHIAQNMTPEDVGWHAGNWYVNAHSIGLEHEGFAAHGAEWYTENMYRTSAELVKYLAEQHDIPLDRAHIIGHDQIPGITPANIPRMHWDPGPYWDWEHYFDLLGAPIQADGDGTSEVWTVKPGFEGNEQLVTGCKQNGTCKKQGTNFVYVHTEPSHASPLVKDIGLRPDGAYSTTHVSDIGARLAAGQKVVVSEVRDRWVKVWYLGQEGWVFNPPGNPDLVPSDGETVSIKPGAETVPVYGRAYPEPAAYEGTGVPVQPIVPLPYTIKPGQEYVLADDDIESDYYRATTYDWSSPGDGDDIEGELEYYLIWFGHRMHYVQAQDVVVNR